MHSEILLITARRANYLLPSAASCRISVLEMSKYGAPSNMIICALSGN